MTSEQEEQDDKIGQQEYDEILSQLVIRVSAMEHAMLEKGVVTPEQLANSTITVMLKLQEVFEERVAEKKPASGFIKHGNKE